MKTGSLDDMSQLPGRWTTEILGLNFVYPTATAAVPQSSDEVSTPADVVTDAWNGGSSGFVVMEFGRVVEA